MRSLSTYPLQFSPLAPMVGRRIERCLVLRKRVVRITVQPALPRLGRGDYGMTADLRVPGGVAVERIVAAKGRAALLAGAQMDPTGAHFHAFFALVALLPLDFFEAPIWEQPSSLIVFLYSCNT